MDRVLDCSKSGSNIEWAICGICSKMHSHKYHIQSIGVTLRNQPTSPTSFLEMQNKTQTFVAHLLINKFFIFSEISPPKSA